jgi:hypothetical protein
VKRDEIVLLKTELVSLWEVTEDGRLGMQRALRDAVFFAATAL